MLIGKRNRWATLGGFALMLLLAASLAAYALGPITAPAPAVAVPRLIVAATAGALPLTSPAAQPPTTAAAAPSDKPTAELCMGCHGPLEKLKARTSGYVTDQSEKVNPHVNVPHDSTKFTTCTECHEAHPLPVTGPVKIAKANVQYCYSACHHMNDFTPCAQCHKEKK